MVDVQKRKISWKGLQKSFKLFKYLKPYSFEYILGLIFLLGSSLTSLAFPKLIGELVKTDKLGFFGQSVNQTIIIIVVLLVLQALFSYFRIVLFINVTEKSLALLRYDTYKHLVKLPVQFFEKHRVGELNSRISSDISLLQETLTTTVAEFLRQIIIIIGGITMLAITSVKLTFFMLAIIPPIMIIAVIFGRFIRRFSKTVQTKIAESNTIVEETLQGIQSVKSFTNEFFEISRYKQKTREIAQLGMKAGKFRGAFSSFTILGLFGAISAVVWQGSKVLDAGDLFSFVVYSVFIGGTIGGMASVYAGIQRFIGATEDLFDSFKEKEEKLDKKIVLNSDNVLTGRIEIKSLTFSYPSRPDEKILDNINLEIDKNIMLALVGSSGAGKSTLASLLMLLHYPKPGQLFFDNKDVLNFPISALRSQIALVPQDIFLFGGTIRENIAYGKPTATDTEIYEAAEKANATEFINKIPGKFNAYVGERGTQLSGGQRQRIAIARAVLKNPKILILDEATSSLDSASEKLVQDALEKLMKGRTSVIIAHRLATVRKADKIVVVENGKIVEEGTHNQLMQIPGGKYKNLSDLQFNQ